MVEQNNGGSGRIAILGGTGNQGYGLALRWAIAGQPITIGSRDASRAIDAAERVRQDAQAAGHGGPLDVEGAENSAAAAAADVVVVTVPFAAQAETIKSVRGSLREGQILVDVTVPLAAAVGGRATRVLGVPQGSAAEQAAELAPKGVRVVGAFHNVSASMLTELEHPVDCDVLLCGKDEAAKERVATLATLLPGVRTIDAGGLEMARIVESITALLIGINIRYKVHGAGIRITGLPQS